MSYRKNTFFAEFLCILNKLIQVQSATSLVVRWLKLHTPSEEGLGFDSWSRTRSHMLQLRCGTVKVYSLREIVWHHKYNSIINDHFPPTFLKQCFIFCTVIFPDILTATGHSSLSVFAGNLHLRMLENHRSEFSSAILIP